MIDDEIREWNGLTDDEAKRVRDNPSVLKPDPTPEYEKHLPEFIDLMKTRLAAGHIEYGDGSFDRPLLDLLAEIEEEILDQVNWSFIQWVRLKAERKQIVRLIECVKAQTAESSSSGCDS
jgi:hypothetical protein